MSQDNTKKIPDAIAAPVKYGELIPMGSDGEEDRTKSPFTLNKRPAANGLKPLEIFDQSVSVGDQHKVTFTTSVETVVVEYGRDRTTDMFQGGRLDPNMGSHIDFPVTDTVPKAKGQSEISRSAFRISVLRSPPYTAHIYAAGFDSSKNIFLGMEAVKGKTEDGQMDGLTTNGVLVKCPGGEWREISLRGHAFAPREPRSSSKRGKRVDGHNPQELMDGSLIDLGGACTLLWRTAEGLANRTTRRREPAPPELSDQLDRMSLNSEFRPCGGYGPCGGSGPCWCFS